MTDPALPDRRRPRRRILDAGLELAADRRLRSGPGARAGRTRRRVVPNDLLELRVTRFDAHRCRRRTVGRPLPPASPTPRRKAERRPPRVNQLISELTETMTANRALTVALLRALLSGKPDVSQYVERVPDRAADDAGDRDRSEGTDQRRPRGRGDSRVHLVHRAHRLGDRSRVRRPDRCAHPAVDAPAARKSVRHVGSGPRVRTPGEIETMSDQLECEIGTRPRRRSRRRDRPRRSRPRDRARARVVPAARVRRGARRRRARPRRA